MQVTTKHATICKHDGGRNQALESMPCVRYNENVHALAAKALKFGLQPNASFVSDWIT